VLITNFTDAWEESKEAKRLKKLQDKVKKSLEHRRGHLSAEDISFDAMLAVLDRHEAGYSEAVTKHEASLDAAVRESQSLRTQQDELAKTIAQMRWVAAGKHLKVRRKSIGSKRHSSPDSVV